MENNTSQGIYDSPVRKGNRYVRQDSIAGDSSTVSRGSIIFRISILVIILIVGGILIMLGYFDKKGTKKEDTSGASSPKNHQIKVDSVYTPIQANAIMPRDHFLLQDITEFVPTEIPVDKKISLTVHWVQQAGWHLGRAQRQYRWKEWKEALKEYGEARHILPGVEGIDEHMGLCHFWLKEYDSAAECFECALKRHPGSSSLLNNLGLVCTLQKNYKKADQYFKKAISNDSDYSAAYFNLGLMYYRKGDMNSAANYLREYLAFDSSNLDAIHLFSLTLAKAERWDEAIIVLESSILMMPKAAPLHFRLAEALCHTGDLDKAMDVMKTALTLVDAKTALTWLSQGEFDRLRERPDYQAIVTELTNAI